MTTAMSVHSFSWRLSAAQNVPWDTERKGRTAPRYHVFGRPADATATATATAADAENGTGTGSGSGSGSEPRRVERMSTNLMEDGGSAEDDKARQRRKDARRARCADICLFVFLLCFAFRFAVDVLAT
jgi:hypothetical protein